MRAFGVHSRQNPVEEHLIGHRFSVTEAAAGSRVDTRKPVHCIVGAASSALRDQQGDERLMSMATAIPRFRSPAWLIVATLLLADLVYGFQQSAITPALPKVKATFGASQEWTTWVFSGYLIVAAVMPIFGGKLADRVGRRRVFLTALIVFLLGSITAGLAQSVQAVVIGRLIQGTGGIVFPLSFSILRDHVDPRWVGRGIGILTGGFGFSRVAGFGLGGAIAEFAGWRWIFVIGVIVLTCGIVLVRAIVPESPTGSNAGLDTIGALLLGATIAMLIIGLAEGSLHGWLAPPVIALFLAAVAAAAIWVWHERHTAYPLMDLRVLASRTVFGLSAGPLLTGIILLPRALGQAFAGPVSGAIIQRIGASTLLSLGLVAQATGAAIRPASGPRSVMRRRRSLVLLD